MPRHDGNTVRVTRRARKREYSRRARLAALHGPRWAAIASGRDQKEGHDDG